MANAIKRNQTQLIFFSSRNLCEFGLDIYNVARVHYTAAFNESAKRMKQVCLIGQLQAEMVLLYEQLHL